MFLPVFPVDVTLYLVVMTDLVVMIGLVVVNVLDDAVVLDNDTAVNVIDDAVVLDNDTAVNVDPDDKVG